MSVANPKTQTVTPRPRKRLISRGSEPALVADSFQATLSGCTQAEADRGSTMAPATTPQQVKWLRWQAICADTLRRAWASLHAKYKISTTKRLRVSETISLGEKRFVAIVAVEGREFLIGGGVAGMSLLAQLGPGTAAKRRVKQKLADVEGAL